MGPNGDFLKPWSLTTTPQKFKIDTVTKAIFEAGVTKIPRPIILRPSHPLVSWGYIRTNSAGRGCKGRKELVDREVVTSGPRVDRKLWIYLDVIVLTRVLLNMVISNCHVSFRGPKVFWNRGILSDKFVTGNFRMKKSFDILAGDEYLPKEVTRPD